jgi:predicted helicase
LFSEADEIVSNLRPEFCELFDAHIEDGFSNSDQQIFDYIVGILSSVAYRSRYLSLLKIDFPRVPIPKATILFKKLSALGGLLSSLQLLEQKISLTDQPKYFGSKEVVVGKIAHIDDVLWIDSSVKDPAIGTSGFSGVSEDVFQFELGGYQICEKWFKDRRGQVLSQVERDHVRKMLGSISKIISIQLEIDELIEENGGFPKAFV